MKKIVSVLVLVTICTIAAYSQSAHFGLKAGANFSKLDVKNGVDYKSKTGLHAGGLVHIHISQHFAVQPEVVFSMQGGEDNANGKLKVNYINVPVLAQYMFNQGFRIQTGPQIGFLVSAEQKTGNTETKVDDLLEGIDFSWSIGAGYLSPSGLGVDARYNFGLTDIWEHEAFEIRNRVFQVGLFYQFMHRNTTVKK